MSETTEKLVGIKQVLLPEFKAAEKAGTTKGYMWFVRDNNITLHNYIYLGSRLYGEAEIEVPFDSVITNILSDNSIVVTKTSSEEGTTVELKINLDPNGGLALTENGLQVDMSKFISQSELDKVKDDIKTVNDNLVTSINTINQNVADGFNTINGGIENEIKPAIAEAKKLAVDETERALTAETNLQTNINVETTERKIDVANLQGNINIEAERALAAEAALAEKVKEVDVDEIKADIKTVNDNLVTAVNTINQNMADGFNTINGGIDNEIRPAIEDLKENKVSYTEAEKEGKKYKIIQLDNYANLVGEGADELSGQTFNIGMVSKWNKVDLGSASLEINLNGKANRPTYNDTKEIALIEDVNGKISSVELVQDVDNQLHYELMVDGVVKGDINIPKDQFLKNVEYDDTTKELVFTFDTTDGEKVTKVNIGELVDTYEAGNGLELNGNIFSIKLDPSSQSYIQVTSDGIKIINIDEVISSIDGKIAIEETRASSVEAKLRTDVDYEHERALEAEANINNALETKVTWDESKSKIVLPSGGQIVGTKYGTDGSNPADGATIAQLSQYDIMDFGSSKYPLNLNVPAGVRVTVQEQGQSGENANKVAYLSDVEVKVDKVEGKGLSEEDFTTALKTKLEGLNNYNDTDIKNDIASLDTAYKTADTALEEKITANEQAIATKVDKVDGMGLSQESFTTALKTKLEGLNNYNDTDIKNDIASLDTAYKTADTALEEKITANEQAIATKVDKVDGMGLSQESFTTALKTKLEGLNNYDDTAIKTSVEENKTNIAGVRSDLTAETTLQATNYNDLNTRLNSEVTRATDRENEIETKINNILSTGLTLPNNESISARPTGSTTSPVNILTLTSGNVVEVGSNIGNLSLKSKSSPVISINDGVAKEIALKEQIDALQTLIDDLTSRVTALETKP